MLQENQPIPIQVGIRTHTVQYLHFYDMIVLLFHKKNSQQGQHLMILRDVEWIQLEFFFL